MSFGEQWEDVDETPAAHAGHVLRRRYRLDELLVRRGDIQTWRGFDVLLARAVLVHLLPADQPNHALLAAAKRAAGTADFRVLRVLDATLPADSDARDDSWLGPYIVCEYAPGASLENLLSAGPLSTLEAAWMVREVADAVAGMHARGLHHQRLTPASVIVTDTGNVKIVGFLLEAAMDPRDDPIGDPQETDVTALGRLLYAALTTRWPGGAEHGLPAAPTDGAGRLLTPREIQANVPSSLDQICDRILSPSPRDGAAPLRTAAQISAALSRVLGTADPSGDLEQRVQAASTGDTDATLVRPVPQAYAPRAPQTTEPAETTLRIPTPARTPKRLVRWRRIVIPLAIIALLGSLIAVGLRLSPWADESPAAGPSAQWPIAAAHDFDPEGNGEEHPGEVPLAWDGNPNTSWTTMNYYEADIGNKTGVGLVFDLGEVRQVSRVELDLDGNGTSLDVRVPAAAAENAATAPPTSPDEWRAVATADRTPAATSISLSQPVETRYVLVFLTALPPSGSQFTGGIAEARFWS